MGTDLTIDGGMGPKSRKVMMDLLTQNSPEGHEKERDYWMDKLLKNFKTVTLDFEKAQNRKEMDEGMKKRINERDQFAREILYKNNPENQ